MSNSIRRLKQLLHAFKPPGHRLRRTRRTGLIEQLEARRLLATIIWGNEAGGNWGVASNWIGGVIPGANDDVIIPDFASSPTITFNSGTTAVKSLENHETLVIAGGSFSAGSIEQIAGSFSLSSGTLRNSTVVTGNLELTGTAFIAGVNIATTATMTANASARIQVNSGTALSILGQANFQAGSRLTFNQTTNASYSELIVGNGGVVTATNATFTKNEKRG